MTTEQFTHCFANPLWLNMVSPSDKAVIQISHWETDSSISQLDAQIKGLQLQCHTLCDHHQMLVTLLSPVHCLAPKLLGEIFHFCLPQDCYDKGAHKAVMLLSYVCKHWRDFALATPILWMNIVLHVTNETFKSQAALVTTWFSQSGSLSLSFTLDRQENIWPIMAFPALSVDYPIVNHPPNLTNPHCNLANQHQPMCGTQLSGWNIGQSPWLIEWPDDTGSAFNPLWIDWPELLY